MFCVFRGAGVAADAISECSKCQLAFFRGHFTFNTGGKRRRRRRESLLQLVTGEGGGVPVELCESLLW